MLAKIVSGGAQGLQTPCSLDAPIPWLTSSDGASTLRRAIGIRRGTWAGLTNFPSLSMNPGTDLTSGLVHLIQEKLHFAKQVHAILP